EFHVWTVNDPDEAKAFRAMSVDSITTDRPEFIRGILGQ
ncbi:MAG: glycerophosphodiester phosphodiesterase, partial [Planctomycetales bacterium]|nr:glycerophosphodiester phosphodiesterase [Planctomycetales bacterium]